MSGTREKYQKVAYYPGCALEGTAHSYNRSTQAVGTALMAGGIAMIVASRTHVTTSDGYTLALGKDKDPASRRPKLALSAAGLHF